MRDLNVEPTVEAEAETLKQGFEDKLSHVTEMYALCCIDEAEAMPEDTIWDVARKCEMLSRPTRALMLMLSGNKEPTEDILAYCIMETAIEGVEISDNLLEWEAYYSTIH